MARSMPPMNWFRVFEAAARHLKFTAAADELGMTQSAVSQQIRSLELRLGVQLFLRQPRGLILTDSGRKLLPKVSVSLEHLQSATEMFDAGPRQDVLTIATSVSIAQWIIAPHLKAFSIAYPHLRIRLLSTIWADDFKSSLADIEIRFGSASQVGQDAKRLGPDHLVPIGSVTSDRDIASAPLIEAVGTSEGWRQWFAASGQGQSVAPSLFVDSYGMAVSLVQNGAGHALVSSLIARPLMAQGQIALLSDIKIPSSEGYFLATRTETDKATLFKEWLLDIIEKGHIE